MRSFQDETGRVWVVNVNVGTIARVKAETGVYLPDWISTTFRSAAEALDDYILISRILYAICRDTAQVEGVPYEDFIQLLAGECLESAINALLEAVVDFFPDRQKQEVLRKLLAKARQVQTDLTNRAEKQLDQVSPTQLAEEVSKELSKRPFGNVPVS